MMRGHTATEELQLAELSVVRARAAVAEEELAANKEALRKAIATGRELTAEYNRLERLYRETNNEAQKYHLSYSILSDKAARLLATEPNTVEDFPSEEDQAAWQAEAESVVAERDLLLAEAQAKYALCESYRLPAIKAAAALEQHRYVVRNLRNKIDDPKGERAIRGWQGGVSEI